MYKENIIFDYNYGDFMARTPLNILLDHTNYVLFTNTIIDDSIKLVLFVGIFQCFLFPIVCTQLAQSNTIKGIPSVGVPKLGRVKLTPVLPI